MIGYRRPFWLYPLFQIPLMLLAICLVMALLFWLLGFGRPPVAVAIALDLSSSTYQGEFNAPGSVMAKEVQAVKAYLEKNTSGVLKKPNQVQILGFANDVKLLTPSFQEDSEKIKQQLDQNLKPSLVNEIGGGTNLDLAIQEGIDVLSKQDRCRELLIVTDGEVSIDARVIAEALTNRVKINAVVLGTDSTVIKDATVATGGRYLSGDVSELNTLFTETLFDSFNNNLRWVLFWVGLAWICLMWMITMPLDRWILQGLLKMPMDLSGKLALGNAFFWSAATPIIFWKLYELLDLAFPFINQC